MILYPPLARRPLPYPKIPTLLPIQGIDHVMPKIMNRPSAWEQKQPRAVIPPPPLRCHSDLHCRPVRPSKHLHVMPPRKDGMLLPLPMPMFEFAIRNPQTGVEEKRQVFKQRKAHRTDKKQTHILQSQVHHTIHGPTLHCMQIRLIISPIPLQISRHTDRHHNNLHQVTNMLPSIQLRPVLCQIPVVMPIPGPLQVVQPLAYSFVDTCKLSSVQVASEPTYIISHRHVRPPDLHLITSPMLLCSQQLFLRSRLPPTIFPTQRSTPPGNNYTPIPATSTIEISSPDDGAVVLSTSYRIHTSSPSV